MRPRAGVQACTNCELLTARAEDVRGLHRIFKEDGAALSRFARHTHASRLALLRIPATRQKKATAFASAPGGHDNARVAGAAAVGPWASGAMSDSGARVRRGELVAGPAAARWTPTAGVSQAGSVVTFARPMSVAGVRSSGVSALGSRMGDATAHEEDVAALMDQLDELAKVQEQLCQTVVALSLQVS